jgi:putative chitinase
MNRGAFFLSVRSALFGGSLNQGQVDGMGAILDEWERRKLSDQRWLAYMLATTYHETARTMQPIAEYGGKSARYAPYYGRGFVQLTWEANYAKAGKIVGVDLVKSPDRAMELPIATVVLFDGMIDGWFTGKKLGDYIKGILCDYEGARKIINGTDKAATIAGYAKTFQRAIEAAAIAQIPAEPAAVLPPKPPTLPPRQPDDPGVPEAPPKAATSGLFHASPVIVTGGAAAAATYLSGASIMWTIVIVIAVIVAAYLLIKHFDKKLGAEIDSAIHPAKPVSKPVVPQAANTPPPATPIAPVPTDANKT